MQTTAMQPQQPLAMLNPTIVYAKPVESNIQEAQSNIQEAQSKNTNESLLMDVEDNEKDSDKEESSTKTKTIKSDLVDLK